MICMWKIAKKQSTPPTRTFIVRLFYDKHFATIVCCGWYVVKYAHQLKQNTVTATLHYTKIPITIKKKQKQN